MEVGAAVLAGVAEGAGVPGEAGEACGVGAVAVRVASGIVVAEGVAATVAAGVATGVAVAAMVGRGVRRSSGTV
jgi:uncharacterized protein involved in propanediol utilization